MHELAEALRIDSIIIESRLSELARRDRTVFLVLDQVVTKYSYIFRLNILWNLDYFYYIHREYLDGLAHEINETLNDDGYLVLADISKKFDLPSDFINAVNIFILRYNIMFYNLTSVLYVLVQAISERLQRGLIRAQVSDAGKFSSTQSKLMLSFIE